MTEAEELIAQTLRPHLGHQEYLGDGVWRCPCGATWYDGSHLAGEIDKALGGLHRITQPEYPACWDGGFKTCEEGPPVSRWVSEWSRGC